MRGEQNKSGGGGGGSILLAGSSCMGVSESADERGRRKPTAYPETVASLEGRGDWTKIGITQSNLFMSAAFIFACLSHDYPVLISMASNVAQYF